MGAALSGWPQRVVGRVRRRQIHVPWDGNGRHVCPGFCRARLSHVVWNGRLQTDRRTRLHRSAGVRRRGAGAGRRLYRNYDRRLSEFWLFDRREHSIAQEYAVNTLWSRTNKGTVRRPWIALLILGTVAVPRGSAWGQSVAGRGVAARLNTPATGIQLFARAVLPAGGGMVQAELGTAGAANMLGAGGFTSIVTGQVGQALVSVTATVEAADVANLSGR